MRICCHFIGWQIEETVALTVKHYKQFCDTVIYYDNYSTDKSVDVAAHAGAICTQFGIRGVLDDGEYTKLKNTCWKGSDFDYVIVCDDDEILYHPDLATILSQEKAIGTTIFKTYGYGIYSNDVPRESWLEQTSGVPDGNYSKTVIFDPKAITDIGFVYGSHVSKPAGRIQWSHTILPVLHYHNVGGIERVIKRHKMYEPRRQKSALNMRFNLGHHYSDAHESETRANFAACLEKSAPLSTVGLY